MKRTGGDYRVDGLEPRILLSADPLGLAENVLPARNADEPALVEEAVRDLSFAAASVDPADGSLDDQMLVPTSVVPDATHLLAAAPLEIVFVDAATPDYDTLVDSLLDENPLRDLRVHVLDANSDGFQSIADILSGYEDVDAIHLISHGSSGSLTLGDAVLNDASVDAHAQSLAAWGNSLTDDADLLIYGCDFAAGEGGREIVARLATLTGADIAASTDLTGAAALGGDWDLEYRHGDVEAAIALNLSVQADFDGVLAAPTPAGGETLVNVTTTGVQEKASVAMYADGDYVVAWQNNDATNFGEILMRRYNADGTPKDGGEVAVHIPGITNESNPSVAVSANGNFVVAWQSNNGSGEDIFAAVYDTDGNTIKSAFVANSTSGFTVGNQTEPDVAMDASGNFVVSWEGKGPGGENNGVFARRFDADGSANGSEFQVNPSNAGLQTDAHVDMNASGAFVVSWTEQAGSGSISAALYDNTGAVIDGSIVAGTGTDGKRTADVGMDDAGRFVVVWEENTTATGREILHRLFDATGTAIDTDGTLDATANPVQVNTFSSGDQLRPSVSMNGNGDYVISWTTFDFTGDAGAGISAREYATDGTPRDAAEFHVNTTGLNSQDLSEIAINDARAMVAVWSGEGTQSGNVDASGVFFQRYAAAGPNTAPSVSLANTVTNFAENTDTTARIKVADISVSDDGLGTNDITLTGTDAALFEVIGTELFIKAGTELDFEDNPTLDVTVNVDDATVGGTPDDTAALAITVTDENEEPEVELANTVTTLAENTNTAARVKVADITIDDDVLGTNNITLTGTDAALFEVDGTELFIKAGTALDFETNPTLNVTVNVDDATVGGNPDDTAALAITITDVNETPTVALANTVTNLAENTDTTARVKVADINITDDALGTESITLSGTDAALFEVDGTELFIKAGTTLDFETNATLDVTVNVDDNTVGGNPDDTAALSISLSDVNEAPTVALANTVTNLAENTDTTARVKVADINITDDALGTESITLSGTDAALFEVDGTELFIKAGTTLDFETKATLDVTVNVDDNTVGGNPDDTAALSISLSDVNEAPTVALANTVTNLAEDTDTTSRVKVADINVTDDALGSESITLTGTDAALFEVDGTELFIKAGTTLDFETNATLDVTVNVDDNTVGGNPDDTAALSISLSDVNEAPTVALANTVTNLAENTDTTARVKVADINVTDDALGSESITLTGADAALFEVDGTELFIKAGTTLDFETNATLDVTVNVDDNTVGGNPDDTEALSISLSDVNEAPTVALANTTNALADTTSTAARIKVADINVSDDALGSETLALTGADAALFEIDGTELFIKAGTPLNATLNPSLDVTVNVDDVTVGGIPDDTAALSIAITNGNTAPTVSLANTVTNIDENTSTVARVKVADITVSDDGNGTNTLALTGTDAALFEIDGTELFIKAGTTLDFETDAALDVSVTVDDATLGGNPDDTAALTVNVTDVNEAPAVTLDNTVTNLAENTDTTSRVKVADINVTDDALGSETITLTGTDAALFEVDGTELFIKAGTTLDFETNATLDVTVNVDDNTVGGNPDDTAALSISLSDVNEAPTVALANTVTNLAENTDTTARVKVADINVTDDALGSESITLTGTDAALFEVDGTELFIKAGTTLDFETNATLDVTVNVDDATVGGNPDDTAALSISLSDVNEAPTVALANTVTNLAENTDTTSRVKVADINVTDDALGSETITLTGTDAALFEVDGTELFIKAGTTLDFETNATLDVTVNVDDATVGGNPDDTAALAINVFDVNETPSVALSNTVTNLSEDTNTASRVKVADIAITDDALGAETLGLTGTDAALFEIDGTELFLKAGTTLDFETKAALDVTVTVDDNTVGGNPDDTAALAITVTDANEAPTVALANTVTNLAEDTNTTARVKVADINVTDDALGTESITLTGADAALFEVDGTELFIKAGTTLDFETNATLDVTVNVDDNTVGGNPDDTAALAIGLTDVNEAPTAVALANATTSLAEDTNTTVRVKVADINVSDDALGVGTLTLTGADVALFEIDGTQLFLKAGTVLDSDAKPNLSVTVNVDDATVGGAPDATVVLSITVAPAAAPEEAPAVIEEEEEVAPAAAPVVAEVELVLEGAEDEAEEEPEPEPEEDAAEVEAAVAAETETTDEAVPEDELDALAAGAGAIDDGAVQAAGATGAEQGRDSRDGAESGTAVGPVSVGVAAASNQLFAGAAPGEFVQVDALLGSLLNQFFAAAGDGSGREGDAAADAELAPVELVRMDTFVSGMDRLREQAEQEAALVKAVVSTGVAASTGVSVGYVVWLIRGGVLLSSVLSSMPAWRFIDPLPILDSAWEATDGDGDDDSLESMVARAADRAGAA